MSVPILFSVVLAVTGLSVPSVLAAPMPAPQAQSFQTSQPHTGLTETEILTRAEQSLTAIDRARGIFSQTAWDGSVETGRFALSRPGRLRFDYDDTPLVIISDGLQVALQDNDLETSDSILLAQTPLSLLLRNDLNFSRDSQIVGISQTDGNFSIEMEDLTGQWDGALTLHFDAAFTFIGWTTLDALGQRTRVDLQDMQLGASLNPRLFIIEDLEL